MNSSNGCIGHGCQTMCTTCIRMVAEEYNPSKKLCICFTCPDCNYQQHEMMMHTCGVK